MRTFAFIDAANLFYGGEKSLGWRIDYQRLLQYLRTKYGVRRALYFGGVETHDFRYDYLRHETVPLEALEHHLSQRLKNEAKQLSEADILLLGRHLQPQARQVIRTGRRHNAAKGQLRRRHGVSVHAGAREF